MHVSNVSITEHFKKLFDFSGRENRASFWPYAAVVFGITMVAGMIIFVPIVANAMREGYNLLHNIPIKSQRPVVLGNGHYSISVRGDQPEFMPAGSIAAFLAVTFGVAILLYAAAVVRRLHDRGKSGF